MFLTMVLCKETHSIRQPNLTILAEKKKASLNHHQLVASWMYFLLFYKQIFVIFFSVILDTYFINCTVCAVYKKIEPSITSSTETMKF